MSKAVRRVRAKDLPFDVIVCEECGTVCESCAGNRAEVRRLRVLLRWVLQQGQQPFVAVRIKEVLGRMRRTKPR